MNSSSRLKVLFGALAVGLTAFACSDASSPTFQGPPPLPRLQSMLSDAELFQVARPTAGTHYNAAAAVVAAANAATIVNMPLSRTIYDAADAAQPEQQSDGYHWIYPVTEGSQVFDADLTGRARGVVDAVWEMHVTSSTSSPALTGFLLFSGRSQLDTAKGEWRIFDPATPTVQTVLLDVFWFREGTDSWRVVFKNIKTGSPNFDRYLEFQSTTDLRRIIYEDATPSDPAIVDWTISTNAGNIHSPTYNGGVKSCWNSQFQNTVCPL